MGGALTPAQALFLPDLVTSTGERAAVRFPDFFTSNIRNPNTRKAYARGLGEFLAWCEARGVTSLAAIQPVHVAAYVEHLTRTKSPHGRTAAFGHSDDV